MFDFMIIWLCVIAFPVFAVAVAAITEIMFAIPFILLAILTRLIKCP